MKILQAIGNIPEVLDGVQMGTEDVPKGPQRSSITLSEGLRRSKWSLKRFMSSCKGCYVYLQVTTP